MKVSVKLFLPAYHNLMVRIILICEETLRFQSSWRILISSQNKSEGIKQVIVTNPLLSLQRRPSSVHSYILSLNSK